MPQASKQATCRRAVFEGEVNAGQSFEKVFTPGLKFVLEALHSGWIVRVLPASGERGAHDYAELATPPYQSVTPLLISTDWSFRAQDAAAWNPRRFRYARDRVDFLALENFLPRLLANDAGSSARVAELVSQQPEATLMLLDARIAPGTADQARTAATVALHLETTPYTVDRGAKASALGVLESIRFRVQLDLAAGVRAMPGVREEATSCATRPTTGVAPASQQKRKHGMKAETP